MAASGSKQVMVGKMMVFIIVAGVGVGGVIAPASSIFLDVLDVSGLRVVLKGKGIVHILERPRSSRPLGHQTVRHKHPRLGPVSIK